MRSLEVKRAQASSTASESVGKANAELEKTSCVGCSVVILQMGFATLMDGLGKAASGCSEALFLLIWIVVIWASLSLPYNERSSATFD